MQVNMIKNPIDDAKLILQRACDRCPRVKFKVGPVWDENSAVEALATKSSWYMLFFGHSHLLREQIMASSHELTIVECPVCNIALKFDSEKSMGY